MSQDYKCKIASKIAGTEMRTNTGWFRMVAVILLVTFSVFHFGNAKADAENFLDEPAVVKGAFYVIDGDECEYGVLDEEDYIISYATTGCNDGIGETIYIES